MALKALALTTVQTVAEDLGVASGSADALLERLIHESSQRVATALDRTLHYTASAVDDVEGYGRRLLLLPRTPLVSVTSIAYVEDDGTTTPLAADAYAIEDAQAGHVRRVGGSVWSWTGRAAGIRPRAVAGSAQRRWRVTYTAGWVTPQQAADDPTLTRDLPYDLEALCIQGVVALYRARGSDPAVTRRQVLDASISYSAERSTQGALAAAIRDDHPTVLRYMRRL